MEEIILKEYQKPHVERLMNILRTNHVAIDISETGAGKTLTTTYISNQMKGVETIVICPNNVKIKWQEVKDKYQNNISMILSYGELRSQSQKHGLLTREDRQIPIEGTEPIFDANGQIVNTEDFITKTIFRPTKELTKKLQENSLFFIFDESQKTKNDSMQSKGSRVIVQAVQESKRSRVLLLSATPADKKEQVERMCRMMGIIKSSKMGYTNENGDFILLGVRDVITRAITLNREGTREYLNSHEITKDTYKNVVYDLFIGIILPHISSKMKVPESDIKQAIYNHYYDGTQEEKDILTGLITELNSKAIFYNRELGEYTPVKGGFMVALINKYMNAIERAKQDIFCREARKLLLKYPYVKVVIIMYLTDTRDYVYEKLKPFGALNLIKDLTQNERKAMLNMFNANNNNHRVLISSMGLVGEGIDLDDQYGNQPRVALVLPSYDIISTEQMIGRFKRANTKSNSIINFVYVETNTGIKETRILRALARKAEVLKDFKLEDKTVNERSHRYPDEYEEIFD